MVLGGESCGPVFEEESCQIPNVVCPKYFWVLGGWSYCQLAEGVTCGHGLRTRGVLRNRISLPTNNYVKINNIMCIQLSRIGRYH